MRVIAVQIRKKIKANSQKQYSNANNDYTVKIMYKLR